MGEKQLTPITVNDKNYILEDLTDEQKYLFQNCVDLDRKISSAQFNLSQLQVGKEAFINKLEASLATPPEAPQETAPAAA
jgi:hypothetical protein